MYVIKDVPIRHKHVPSENYEPCKKIRFSVSFMSSGTRIILYSSACSVFTFIKDSACEQVVSRDINRTFPAHDYFKETGGVGQDSLYKICKVTRYIMIEVVR